ncbi:hypothetical protein A2U01_0088414, partial [Trifolium medium]|nr:hypothetical protein [Trifolium medium]
FLPSARRAGSDGALHANAEEVGVSSVNCAPRRRGWRGAPVYWKDASGTLGCWRVAQLHPA